MRFADIFFFHLSQLRAQAEIPEICVSTAQRAIAQEMRSISPDCGKTALHYRYMKIQPVNSEKCVGFRGKMRHFEKKCAGFGEKVGFRGISAGFPRNIVGMQRTWHTILLKLQAYQGHVQWACTSIFMVVFSILVFYPCSIFRNLKMNDMQRTEQDRIGQVKCRASSFNIAPLR